MDILVTIMVLGFFAISLPAVFIFLALLEAIFGDEQGNDRLLHQEDYEPKNVKR